MSRFAAKTFTLLIAFSGRLNTGIKIQTTPKVLPRFALIRSEAAQKFQRNVDQSGKPSNCSSILGQFALIYLVLDVAETVTSF